ncbi:unnamed protein product [Urochloa humidicola]
MASGSNNPIVVGAHPRPAELAHLGEPIENLEVSTCVVKQLGITHDDQTEVRIAFVKGVQYDPFVSANVCLAKELGHYNLKIVKDYTTPSCPPSPRLRPLAEVDKLNGHMMGFAQETINFRRVLNLSEAIWADCRDWPERPRVVL